MFAPHHKTDCNKGLAVEEHRSTKHTLRVRKSAAHLIDRKTKLTPIEFGRPIEFGHTSEIARAVCARAQRQLGTIELSEKAGGNVTNVRDDHPHVLRRLHKANVMTEAQSVRHCPFPENWMQSCVSTN